MFGQLFSGVWLGMLVVSQSSVPKSFPLRDEHYDATAALRTKVSLRLYRGAHVLICLTDQMCRIAKTPGWIDRPDGYET